jgi:AcrR family transcriptional regulator
MSETRQRILAHACDLYLSDGLDGFSMRKLARAVGVTAPALYRHFESKEQLLHDVMVQAYEQFARYLYRALVGTTPRERIQMASVAYLDFALEHPKLYDILFATPATSGIRNGSDELEALGCAVGQFWHDRVRECMDEGILAEGDPEAVSVTMWGHAHGLLTLHRKGILVRDGTMDEADFRELFEASGLRVLRGLATPEHMALVDAERAGDREGGVAA